MILHCKRGRALYTIGNRRPDSFVPKASLIEIHTFLLRLDTRNSFMSDTPTHVMKD